MTDAVEQALALYPQLQRVVDLRNDGWLFRLVGNGGVAVTSVMGMYRWVTDDGIWADFIAISGENECVAMRLTPNREPVWAMDSTLNDVVDALLDQPHPDSASAPRRVLGERVPDLAGLWTPPIPRSGR